MSRIKLVTASAGTGKTYYLTDLVYEAIRSGEVAPEALLVTTFTRRAAAELQQRCRRRLLAAGNAAEAHRLAAARIGTVHSICGRLVTDFAFELGISPDVRVLDEVLAGKTLRRSLSKVVSSQEQEELAKLKYRMPELDWDDFVEQIVAAARNNGLTAEELGESRERSLATAVQLLGPPAPDGAELDRRLCAALQSMIDGVDRASDSTKTTADAVERAERDLRTLQRGERLSWRDWASLASLKTGKQSARLVEPVHQAATFHDVHPALHDDVRRSIELVFSIAARAYEAYQERKREWGVVDFVDQEAVSLQLLRMEPVREQLATEIRRVFIDEFQDTSPLQLAIFLKLAEIAELSVWVGDRKQAIFGFRGTDPALMSAAVAKLGRDDSEPKEPEPSLAGTDPALIDDAVKSLDDDLVEVLDKNWRSRPPLVALTSDLFAVGFAPHGFSEREVRCSAAIPEAAGLGPTVEYWELDLENRARRAEYPRALAVAIDELLRDPGAMVRDRATDSVRRVMPGDLAILCRRHLTARRVATALGEQGVRTALPRPGLWNTPEVRAAVAGLRLWIDPSERLARAELARVLLDPEKVNLLEEVIRANASRESVPVPALERVEQVRAESGDAGPLEALDRVIEGLGLRERCRCWEHRTSGWRTSTHSAPSSPATRQPVGLSASPAPWPAASPISRKPSPTRRMVARWWRQMPLRSAHGTPPRASNGRSQYSSISTGGRTGTTGVSGSAPAPVTSTSRTPSADAGSAAGQRRISGTRRSRPSTRAFSVTRRPPGQWRRIVRSSSVCSTSRGHGPVIVSSWRLRAGN